MDLKGFSPKSSFRVPGRFGGLRVLTRYLPLPLVATMLALPAAATIDRWGYTSYLWQPVGEGPHDYNDAANYEGEHKPVSFEGVYYTSGGTVRIPAATARWCAGCRTRFRAWARRRSPWPGGAPSATASASTPSAPWIRRAVRS